MRKLKKIVLSPSCHSLTTNAMANIIGGSTEKEYHYFLRCNQDSESGYDVQDCERSTAMLHCGEDLSNAVCVQVYY